MKPKALLLLVGMFFLVGCSNNTIQNAPIKVELVSVQELNDENFIKNIEKKKDEKMKQIYHLYNDNFTIINKKEINECNNPENIITDNYAIKNETKQKNLDSKVNNFLVYKKAIVDGKLEKCSKVLTINNKLTYKALEKDGLLYLETDYSPSSLRHNLYQFNGEKIVLVKNNIPALNNMIVVNNNDLLVSYGNQIYLLDGKTRKFSLIEKADNNEIWTVSAQDKLLNVVVKDKNNDLFLYKYVVPPNKTSLKSLKDLTMIAKKKLVFSNKEYARNLSQRVTIETDNYVVIGKRMVCDAGYIKCKYTLLDGETIENVAGDFILYNSYRTYLVNFPENTKETISSLIFNGVIIDKNLITFKIYNSNRTDYQYFEYTLKR